MGLGWVARKRVVFAVTTMIVAMVVVMVGVATSAAGERGGGDFAGFTIAVSSPQTAGAPFQVTITAYDSDHDGDADYTGTKCVKFSGAPNSPNNTPPSYPAPTGTCPAGDSTLSFNSSYQAKASVTLFDAQSAAKLTVTDVATGKNGTSGAFAVNPATLDHFTLTNLTPASPETAGTPFAVTVSAFDKYGNAASGWISANDCVVFSGPGTIGAYAPAYPIPVSCGSASASSLGFNATGQATANITLYKAESPTLTVADAATQTHTGTVGLTVNPATLLPTFSGQPGTAQVSMPIYNNPVTLAPVTVSVADTYGNVAPDNTVVTMTAPPGLGGTTSEPTTGGIASFSTLTIGTIGTYQLTAQVGAQPTMSQQFQVVVQLAVCQNVGSCQVSASNSVQSASSSASSGTGTSLQGVVLTTTFVGTPPPAGLCPGFTPLSGTTGISVEASGGNISTAQPSFTVTFTIPPATLRAAGVGPIQALLLPICLGVKRYDGYTDPAHAWTTRNGTPATYDPTTGFYWGLVGDWPSWLPPISSPHIIARYFDSSGNLVIVLVKPYPWDGWGYI